MMAWCNTEHRGNLGKQQKKDNNCGKPIAAESKLLIFRAARKSTFLFNQPHGPAIIAKAIDPINEKSRCLFSQEGQSIATAMPGGGAMVDSWISGFYGFALST